MAVNCRECGKWTEETGPLGENLCGSCSEKRKKKPVKRTFESGAFRNSDKDKLDYEGFLSPLVIERYAKYLHKHRKLEDGTFRDSDNWQKGIPLSQYMKSAFRHFIDWWKIHRCVFSYKKEEDLQDSICALIFNASGYLHERLKVKGVLEQ